MVADAWDVPLSLLAIVLLFVPGLVGLEVLLRTSQRRRSYSRTHLIVYSSILSMGSLFCLYVLTPIYFDGVVAFTDSIVDTLGIVTFSDGFSLSGANLVALYVLHVGFACGIGWIGGKVIDWRQGGNRDRREPWHYAFSVVPSAGEEIEVVLHDGTIVHGSFNEEAWDESRRELYLDDPEEIVYADDGSGIEERTPLGRSILLHEQAIIQVVFIEQDPQRDIAELLDRVQGALDEVEDAERIDLFGEAIDQLGLEDFESSESSEDDDAEEQS